VLRATFQHLPSVGPQTEVYLWREGVTDWSHFQETERFPRISGERLARLKGSLLVAEDALEKGDAAYFARRLPFAEHWRLFRDFSRRTAFLDIETTGLSPHHGTVTCATVHGGGRTRTFVQGDDLEELPAYLRNFDLLVTFNGLYFDVPFLQVTLPGLAVPAAHADLRFLLRRLGQRGGLKIIEKRLGFDAREGVEGIDGLEAVRLWHAHRAGVPGALEKLLAYNRADTVNLEPLMVYACAEMERRLLHRGGPEIVPGGTLDDRLDPYRALR
jgi:uncharacterized protein YprB with RNaseH-like and TPR domain